MASVSTLGRTSSRASAPRVNKPKIGWDAVEGEQDGKSAAAKRRAPILDPMAPMLAAHKLATRRDGDALVFGRTATEPFVPSTVRSCALKAWEEENERCIEQADDPKSVELLEPIGLHDGRHTCASLLIGAGLNAQGALGHPGTRREIAMAFDTYGHLMPGGLDEAATTTNAYLLRLGGQRLALTVVG
jgi:integrase